MGWFPGDLDKTGPVIVLLLEMLGVLLFLTGFKTAVTAEALPWSWSAEGLFQFLEVLFEEVEKADGATLYLIEALFNIGHHVIDLLTDSTGKLGELFKDCPFSGQVLDLLLLVKPELVEEIAVASHWVIEFSYYYFYLYHFHSVS